jgi:hypothetical protein
MRQQSAAQLTREGISPIPVSSQRRVDGQFLVLFDFEEIGFYGEFVPQKPDRKPVSVFPERGSAIRQK